MITIKRIVNAQAFASNSDERKIFRVIGSVDMNGRGLNHEIADIDPIIFLDEAFMLSHEGSALNAHPHRGLVAISYIFKGAIIPRDNLHGESGQHNYAGGVYHLTAGRGVVHHESADQNFPELHWLQLWFPRNAVAVFLAEQCRLLIDFKDKSFCKISRPRYHFLSGAYMKSFAFIFLASIAISSNSHATKILCHGEDSDRDDEPGFAHEYAAATLAYASFLRSLNIQVIVIE